MEYCRVCLAKSDSHESFTAEHREHFFQVTSVYIDESEKEFICAGCLKRLLQANEFRLEAIKADLWFRENPSIDHEPNGFSEAESPKEVEKPPRQQLKKKRRRKALKNVKKKRPKRPLYVCDKCTKEYHTKREIAHHMRHRHITREFVCTEKNCGQKFSLLRAYRHHVSKHTLTKWICEYCAKSFNTKYKLTLHLRSHTNVRPFKCSQCTASFKQQTDLNTHLRSIHSNDRPFTCTDCGLSFKIPNSLRSHRKRMHNHKGMLTCSECHKRLMCNSELKDHMVS